MAAAMILCTLPVAGQAGARAAAAEPDGPPAAAGEGETAGAPPSGDDGSHPDEIVVTAEHYGEALVEPETELGEEDIGSYGADSIGELVDRISPLLGGTDEAPVLLVNGERIGSNAEISVYPPEALARLAVLPPAAASRYGYPANRRVVNLVLKRHFVNWQGEAGVSFATAGGRRSDRGSAGRVVIDGPTRWNVQLQMSRDGALFKSDRAVPSGGPVDLVGRIVPASGDEIDPVLSELAGEPVRAAAIPPAALAGIPSLADFAATANRVRLEGPDRYETLLPSARRFAFNAGVTRRLGPFNASFSLNANIARSAGRRGIPMAAIALPAGSPWSPFGEDVLLVRGLDGDRSLRNSQESKTLGFSLVLNGRFADWQTTLLANYSRGWSDSTIERGIDTRRIQDIIDAGDPGFNPYGAWPENFLLRQRNRARTENMRVQLSAGKTVLSLPAGPLTSNISLGASRNRAVRRSDAGTGDDAIAITARRQRLNGQVSLAIPLFSRSRGSFGAIGDLSVDLAASGDIATGAKLRRRFDGAVNWSPSAFVQLRGALEYQQIIPSFDQLDGPRIETIGRVYDFVRQEIAEPLWVTGGNPELGEGSRQGLSLTAMLRPFDDGSVTLDFGYRRQVARGATASFPELTPAVEAAFPERITRDASGRLEKVDARAINLARETGAQLTSGLTWRLAGQAPRDKGTAASVRMANPLQLTVSLDHSWQLRNDLLVREGVPVIDYLRGGGQPRHGASLQLLVARRGLGANLSGNWSGGARLRGAAGNPDFRYRTTTRFNLRLFAEPEHWGTRAGAKSWRNDLMLSLDVDNLFNSYRRITLGDGSVPEGYRRDEIDPLGRTVRLSLRKRF